MRSIIDIMGLSVLRALLFLVLFSYSSRSMLLLRRATRTMTAFCTLSSIFSIAKFAAFMNPPNGVPCAITNGNSSLTATVDLFAPPVDPDGELTFPRDTERALAVVVVSLCASLLEVVFLLLLKKMIRKDEQMSAILLDIEANTSSAASPLHHNNTYHTSSDAHDADAAPPNVKQLVDRARGEALWLFAGCAVLMVRLPFSLALPHFVSETISALILKDFAAAKTSISYFVAAGIVDALLDFWCVFLRPHALVA